MRVLQSAIPPNGSIWGTTPIVLKPLPRARAALSEDALNISDATYDAVIKAQIHRAPSIKVAEAAKVIENTQHDLNIALMNELAV